MFRNKLLYNSNFLFRSQFINNQAIKRYVSDSSLLKNYKNQFKKYNRTSTYDPEAHKLIQAIRDKDFSSARKLINVYNVNINGHDKGENTPLTDCAKRGDREGTQFLINNGAGLHNSCDCPYHMTALHYSIKYKNYDCTKILLNAGADPNIMDSNGKTALDYVDSFWGGLLENQEEKVKRKEVKVLLENYGAKFKHQIEKEKEFVYLPKN